MPLKRSLLACGGVSPDLLQQLAGTAPDANLDALAALDETVPASASVVSAEASHRWQDPVIESLVPRACSVLDLGCGDGTLLARLMAANDVCAQGVELDQGAVLRCIERGVPVFHGDLDEGLRGFPDASVDIVILEQTLQTLHRPVCVLEEMLRVGRCGVVSFPNFAHWRVRKAFGLGGRMPVTQELPNSWHTTPNIHLCSIRDFLDWALSARVRVLDAYVLADGVSRKLCAGDNLTASEALFVLDRP
jgi:methionine biosynthesis protein MetW